MKFTIFSKTPSVIWINSKEIADKIDPNYNKAIYMENLDSRYEEANINIKENGDIIEELTDYTANGSFAWLKENVKYSNNKEVPFIKIKNITEFGFDFNDLAYVTKATYENLKKSQLKGGELLFSKTGSVGVTLVVPTDCEKMSLGDNIFKVKYKPEIDVHYIDAFFKSIYGSMWVSRFLQGGVQKTIIKESFRQIKVPIPFPEIQKYIGDKVRKAEELREETKRLKKEAEEILKRELASKKVDGELINTDEKNIFIYDRPNIVYVKANLIDDSRIEADFYRKEDIKLDMEFSNYSNGYRLLGDICNKITDGTHKTPQYTEDGVVFISSKNVLDNEIDFNNTKYISKEEHEEISKRCNVESGDILFTKVGRIGYAKVVPREKCEFSIFVSVALLKLNESINPYYVEAFLNSDQGRRQSVRLCKGSNQPDFHLEDIAKIKIPIPSIEKQNEIGDLMKRLEELKNRSKRLIQEAKKDVEDLIEGNFDMSKLNQS